MPTNRNAKQQRRRRGNELNTRLRSVTVFVLLVTFQAVALAQPPKAQVTQIRAYVAEVDQYIKRNARLRRIFADVAEYDKTPSWREFKTEAEAEKASNLNQSADVWLRGDKVVAANLTFTSPSGDWAHLIMYYFRSDGSLAKIEAQLNTFYGDVSIVRDQYYNSRGVRISSTQKFLDLKTQKPKKKPGDYFDQPVPVYRKVSELPFHKLL